MQYRSVNPKVARSKVLCKFNRLFNNTGIRPWVGTRQRLAPRVLLLYRDPCALYPIRNPAATYEKFAGAETMLRLSLSMTRIDGG